MTILHKAGHGIYSESTEQYGGSLGEPLYANTHRNMKFHSCSGARRTRALGLNVTYLYSTRYVFEPDNIMHQPEITRGN
jgi:hypothetical protein